jgi:ATP-binding cassette subfamily C (CFTR/MRP) protein 1
MVSVERVHEYATQLEREAALVEPAEARPSASWMSHGEVTAENVTMRYRPELPTVLNGISLKIKERERVGIVGRTGCGKSSFLSALMRLVEIQEGHFRIDGLDLKTIGLHTLRSKVAIIPQDPAILTGTVRFNLDPFGRTSGEELWTVLEKAQLKLRVEKAGGLDSAVAEGGGNYSVGELQLLCMARALLRRKDFNGGGLLLLDEATSALDADTDEVIQRIIREDFTCTTITIAHRIQTLLDYDRVVVLAAGKVVEFDTPKALLAMPSEFQALAREGGVDVSAAAR